AVVAGVRVVGRAARRGGKGGGRRGERRRRRRGGRGGGGRGPPRGRPRGGGGRGRGRRRRGGGRRPARGGPRPGPGGGGRRGPCPEGAGTPAPPSPPCDGAWSPAPGAPIPEAGGGDFAVDGVSTSRSAMRPCAALPIRPSATRTGKPTIPACASEGKPGSVAMTATPGATSAARRSVGTEPRGYPPRGPTASPKTASAVGSGRRSATARANSFSESRRLTACSSAGTPATIHAATSAAVSPTSTLQARHAT